MKGYTFKKIINLIKFIKQGFVYLNNETIMMKLKIRIL